MAAIETYRGVVAAWECDVFAHLTIAYYFDRIADASAALRHRLGLDPGRRTTGVTVRYVKELRAGDGHHVESGVVDATRFGHRVLDSATGEVTTEVEETLDRALDPGQFGVAWEKPAGPDPAPPASEAGFVPTGRDAVKPAELGLGGGLSLTGYVHRFSGACLQIVTRFGMTPAYMRAERRGFSTFETRLRLHGDAVQVGDLLELRSAVRQIGGSSIRLLHRMIDARTGRLVAEFHQSGVHFDLEARRSAPWPETLRDQARAITVG